ncbi:MAG: hypothetical protein GX575_25855, partial [Candidatus Anammoximicrobium sp.]|nr:hypothetical protein [Candidatus Anammoximicrobium sp.]
EHSDDPDDLMAPVLSASSVRAASSSIALPPSAFALPPSSVSDAVMEELGGDSDEEDSSDDASPLVTSQGGDQLAAVADRASEEATQAKVLRRSRLQRYERDADAWFAELAGEEAGQ